MQMLSSLNPVEWNGVPNTLQCDPAKEVKSCTPRDSNPGPTTWKWKVAKASAFDLSASEPSLSCAHQKLGDNAAAAAAAAVVGGETERSEKMISFESCIESKRSKYAAFWRHSSFWIDNGDQLLRKEEREKSGIHLISVPVVLDGSSGCVEVGLSCLEPGLEILGFLPEGGRCGLVSSSFCKVSCMLNGINQLSYFQKNLNRSCFSCHELLEVVWRLF